MFADTAKLDALALVAGLFAAPPSDDALVEDARAFLSDPDHIPHAGTEVMAALFGFEPPCREFGIRLT